MSNRLVVLLDSAYRSFRKPRTTAVIISVLMLLYFAGILIPQKRLFQSGAEYEGWKARNPVISTVIETLGLNTIHTSPVTVLFVSLFFLNLAVVVLNRAPAILRRAYILRQAPVSEDAAPAKGRHARRIIITRKDPDSSAQDVSAEEVGGRIRAFMKKRLWSVIEGTGSGPAEFLVLRNRYSPLGFFLFHVSFFLCLIGGMLIAYTRFSGSLVLTEGEEFLADMKRFRVVMSEPKIFHALPPFGIILEKVSPQYEKGVGTDLSVGMRMSYEGEVGEAKVKVNEPVKKGPLTILAKDIGVSPLFLMKTPDGRVVDGGYFSLKVLKGAEDSFEFPSLHYTVFVRFYPDYAVIEGKETSRSPELRNPAVNVRIQEGDKVLYRGSLRLRETVTLDQLVFSFEDVRYWVDFLVVREYGSIPLIIGFAVAGIGLIMRLVFYQKELRFRVEKGEEGCEVLIRGRSEYYRYSFAEEMDLLTRNLANSLRVFGEARVEQL